MPSFSVTPSGPRDAPLPNKGSALGGSSLTTKVSVPPYSGAVTISPVVGSSTISFSIAAAGSSSSPLANVTVATSASASVSTMSFGVTPPPAVQELWTRRCERSGPTRCLDLGGGGRGSVGVGGVAVSGVELVLEPVEGGLVDPGGRFDDGPGDIASHESPDGLHLAA